MTHFSLIVLISCWSTAGLVLGNFCDQEHVNLSALDE